MISLYAWPPTDRFKAQTQSAFLNRRSVSIGKRLTFFLADALVPDDVFVEERLQDVYLTWEVGALLLLFLRLQWLHRHQLTRLISSRVVTAQLHLPKVALWNNTLVLTTSSTFHTFRYFLFTIINLPKHIFQMPADQIYFHISDKTSIFTLVKMDVLSLLTVRSDVQREKENAWVVEGRTSPRARTFLRNLFSNIVGSTSAVGLGLMDGSEECKHVEIHTSFLETTWMCYEKTWRFFDSHHTNSTLQQ